VSCASGRSLPSTIALLIAAVLMDVERICKAQALAYLLGGSNTSKADPVFYSVVVAHTHAVPFQSRVRVKMNLSSDVLTTVCRLLSAR